MLAFRTHRRRLRTTVWVTLLAWLFALTAGVANACVLSVPGAAMLGLSAESHAAHSQAVADTEDRERGSVAHHKHGQSRANDSCLKFCDDESSALSKSSTSAMDPSVALVAAVELPTAVVPIANIGTHLLLQRPSAQGPPLVIRLLRLTL